ncbi:MAG: hypothetical protein Q9227_002404 [Pyrenula ochraceoflavens]
MKRELNTFSVGFCSRHTQPYLIDIGVLGHSDFDPGISGMTPQPDNDRSQANFRFYCDNDPQDVDGNSRWRLKQDPYPLPPHPYVRQIDRPPYSEDTETSEPFREWVDYQNGVEMGETNGCQHPLTDAETYYITTPKFPGQKQPRATITLCDSFLDHEPIPSLDKMGPDVDLERLEGGRLGDGSWGFPIDHFLTMTAFVLLHEARALTCFRFCTSTANRSNLDVPSAAMES